MFLCFALPNAVRASLPHCQRPRYRLGALESKTVHELRRLSSAVGVDTRGCLEKLDLVRCLQESGRIEVFEDPPHEESRNDDKSCEPLAFSMEALQTMSITRLKALAASLGDVTLENCVEKSDIVLRVASSSMITVCCRTTHLP